MPIVNTMNAKRATDEVAHAQEELEYFYLEARRNKKLANWAAKKLGIDKKDYFLELVGADLTQAGPKPVIDRIMEDFSKADIAFEEEEIWLQLREFEKEVLQTMLAKQAKLTRKEIKEEKKNKKKSKK